MTAKTYQICTNCIMDTSDTEITFDEHGVCNHCKSYYAKEKLLLYDTANEAQAKLNELVTKIKSDQKDSDYDCIVGVSGGVDSSYVAYLAKKLGLRVLAVHLDNGWNSELAVMNIENIVKKCGFEYETWVIDWEEFKDLQIAFLRASVANVEIPTDHAFLAALYKIATKHNVKYLLSGSNVQTEGILPASWGYNAKDVRHVKAIYRKFGKGKFKTYPLLGFFKEFYYTYIKGIKMIRLLNYYNYNKAEAMKIIENELGWKYYGGKHYESIFTRFFQAYILPEKFNIDKRRAHLSSLICSNQITREQALEEMKKETYPVDLLEQDKEYVIKKLGLSKPEFEEIMSAPPKSYKDYPNQEAFLKIVYKVYNFIRRK